MGETDGTDGLSECFFVNGYKGIAEICFSPAKAINDAYETAAVVTNAKGETAWIKGNRVTKNQIMAIKENSVTEDKNSLAVCLDTVLQFEGYLSDAATWLKEGQSAFEILQNNMTEYRVMDLSGCTLDAVLYYVNKDIPVLATVENGNAVLVTGFNEFNVVIMEPSTGKLYKKGMKDSTEWFQKNGNHFITYARSQ